MASEIEILRLQLEADFSRLTDDVNEALRRAEARLEDLERAARRTSDSAGSSFSALGSIITGVVTLAISDLISKFFELGAAAIQAFGEIKNEAISLNAEMETATIIFTNMFGDKDAALSFMESLRDQSVKLGISFREASRIAKSILPDVTNQEEFNELLRLFAIGATDAGVSLDELTNDINEAVTGDLTLLKDSLDIPKDAIARIKESGNVTAALADELNKLFTKRGINDLDAFSDTLDTATKKLEGFRQNLLLIGGAPLLEGQREDLQRLNEFLLENQESIEQFARVIGEATEVVRSFFSDQALGALESIDTQTFDDLVDALDDLVAAVSVLLDVDLEGGIDGFVQAITVLIDTLTIVINSINNAKIAFEDVQNSQITAWAIRLTEVFLDIVSPISKLINDIRRLNSVIEAVTGSPIVGWSRDAAEATKTQAQKTEELREVLERLNEEAKKTGDAPFPFGGDETEEQAELLKEKIGELAEDFIDAREKADEKLQKLAEDNQEKIAEIEEDGAEKRADIIEKSADKIEKLEENAAKKRQEIGEDLADDLADLERETAEQREDIISSTDQAIADLQSDTDNAVAEQQADFNRSEIRAQEDHNRGMQRLEEDFLDNLEDAVGARDARAIVNLRKQHSKEVQQREEDFTTDRQRSADDNARAIEEAREAERQKQEELERLRQEELQKLEEDAEEEKQKKIQEAEEEKDALEEKLAAQLLAEDEAKAERLASLDEEIAERREKEDEALAERQEAIQEGLKARLEAVAKGLLEENEMTEEGARAILETLNEHFGIGGNVDQLINDFVSRKAETLRVQLELEIETSINETGRRGSGGLSGGQGARGGARGERLGAPTPEFTFAQGGGLIANRPTTVQFAEAGPELAAFIPLDKLLNLGGDSGEDRKTVDINLQFSGSAPPGVGTNERDAIAGVIVEALRQSGIGVSATLGGSPSGGIVAGEPKR